MGGLLSGWKQVCDGGGATAGMLRCGSASAAHSSGTTVLPGSYELSNFSGGRSIRSLDPLHPDFREPANGEWVVGLYTSGDGKKYPVLLWADPKVDLFWDPSRLEHVKPPGSYLMLEEQPQIDGESGYPIKHGAVSPFWEYSLLVAQRAEIESRYRNLPCSLKATAAGLVERSSRAERGREPRCPGLKAPPEPSKSRQRSASGARKCR